PAGGLGQLRRRLQHPAARRLCDAHLARRVGSEWGGHAVRADRELVGRGLPDGRGLRDERACGLHRREGGVVRRGLQVLAIAAFAGMTITGCGQGPAAAPTGERPTIVSLNPCTDAILAEVADPAQVLAISHFSHDPRASSMPIAEARRFRAAGGTVEEVLALDPDVVVAGSFLPPATTQAFARLGVRVETFGIVSDLEENAAQVRRLAALAGHPERGEALLARIDAALAAARHEGP